MEIFTKSAKDTQNFGQEFGSRLKGGEVLALVGELGSGKTTFVQGLAKGFGIQDRIISPTFILMRQYEINFKFKISNLKFLYHIDLYRLESNAESEFRKLGIEDLWGKKESVVVIEWADKVKNLLPKGATWISFEGSGDVERRIIIK